MAKPGAGGVSTVHAELIDQHIAERIRFRRKALGLSMGRLAHLAGISRHTLLRYELKVHPVPASTLMILAKIMRVPISYFFEEDTYAIRVEEKVTVPDGSYKLTVVPFPRS